jgi:hypothetical protein
MSHQRPLNLRIFQLRHAQLSRKRSVGLVIDVLSSHGNLLVSQSACEQQVDGGRGNDGFGVCVEVGLVEIGDYAGDGFGGAVPARNTLLVQSLQYTDHPVGSLEQRMCRWRGRLHLKVSADDESASHDEELV